MKRLLLLILIAMLCGCGRYCATIQRKSTIGDVETKDITMKLTVCYNADLSNQIGVPVFETPQGEVIIDLTDEEIEYLKKKFGLE